MKYFLRALRDASKSWPLLLSAFLLAGKLSFAQEDTTAVEDEFDLVVEAIQQAWCQEMTNAETVEEITAMQNIFIQDTSWSHSKGTIECSNLETQSWVQAQVLKLCSSTELFRAWSTEELKSQKFASCFIDLRAKFIEPRLSIQTALKATGLTGQFTILRSQGHKSPSPF